MKRLITFSLLFILLVVLVSCGGDSQPEAATTEEGPVPAQERAAEETAGVEAVAGSDAGETEEVSAQTVEETATPAIVTVQETPSEQSTPAGEEAAPAVEETAAVGDIVDAIMASDVFSTLQTAVQAAGLEEVLRGEGPFTVFLPTNEAFDALPDGVVDGLLAHPDVLSRLLLFHVVPGKVPAADLTDGLVLDTMLNGGTLDVAVDSSGTKIGGWATIINPDLVVGNGVVHVVDAVILPSDEVMAAAASSETQPAAEPEAQPAGTAVAPESMPEQADILGTISTSGDFDVLLGAFEATGLEETLRGAGPFTLFAPTDEAFAALPAGTLDALMADPAALKQVLLYHVLPTRLVSSDISGSDFARTMLATSLKLQVSGGEMTVEDVLITMPDIETSNGIIHVMDTVLLPKTR